MNQTNSPTKKLAQTAKALALYALPAVFLGAILMTNNMAQTSKPEANHSSQVATKTPASGLLIDHSVMAESQMLAEPDPSLLH